MNYILSDLVYTQHLTGHFHPEQPARIIAIDQALKESNLEFKKIKPRFAPENDILLCHKKEYLKLVKEEVDSLPNDITIKLLSTGDAPISTFSWDIARLAVGGALEAVDQVMKAPNSTAFAAVRPPGHHATSSQGMGFCIFNNVAIAARYAQKKYGLSRILIADWDVHHGNGTQEIFYEDPSVFYFSTHEKGLYPNTGFEFETGAGAGIGATLNCPIVPTTTSRIEVIHAFEKTLTQKMESFQPELVLISAGFDAHQADPLGHFNLTENDFQTLTYALKAIANKYAQGRIVSVLEGGYNLPALASSVVSHIKALIRKD